MDRSMCKLLQHFQCSRCSTNHTKFCMPARHTPLAHLARLLSIKYVDQVQPTVALEPDHIVAAAMHHLGVLAEYKEQP